MERFQIALPYTFDTEKDVSMQGMTLAWPGKEHVRVHLALQANWTSARPRCQSSAFGRLTLHPNPSSHSISSAITSPKASSRLVEEIAPALAAMFAKAERTSLAPGAFKQLADFLRFETESKRYDAPTKGTHLG